MQDAGCGVVPWRRRSPGSGWEAAAPGARLGAAVHPGGKAGGALLGAEGRGSVAGRGHPLGPGPRGARHQGTGPSTGRRRRHPRAPGPSPRPAQGHPGGPPRM